MRLVLTHSAQHFAPKRYARYTPMPATAQGVSFLCFERTRMVKTLRYAPARSLMYSVTGNQRFASLYPLTSSASLYPTVPCTKAIYHLLFTVTFATITLAMSNYHLQPRTTLPSLAAQEAKEKRRKQLEAVRQRR